MKLCAIIWSQKNRLQDLQFCIQRQVVTLKSANIKTYIAIENSFKFNIFSPILKNFNFIKFSKTKWQNEWLDVLKQLKRQKYTHLFSLIDDFYIFSNDYKLLNQILNFKNLNKIEYLNLNYHPDQIHQNTNKIFKMLDVVPINSDYRSSVQFSFWKIDYMKKMILKSHNIWSLENTSNLKTIHYCVKKPVIRYRHIIEKNQWNYNIFRLPLIDLIRILTKSKIKYNFSQFKIMHLILISNLFINLFGLNKWKKIKSKIYKYFHIA
jgi:hypothetical protein